MLDIVNDFQATSCGVCMIDLTYRPQNITRSAALTIVIVLGLEKIHRKGVDLMK